MVYVDAHCHLDLFENIQNNVKKINDEGIKTISVTNSPTFFQPNQQLFRGHSNIRVALGLHPELAHHFGDRVDLFEQFIGSTKYVGEIGLDGSNDFRSTFNRQVSVFHKILDIVKESGNKILTIHSRNASQITITSLVDYLQNANCGIILHWFTGSLADLQTASKYGFYFSVNHKMTQSKKGRELISKMPLNSLLTETDAPFTLDSTQSRLESLQTTLANIALIKSLPIDEVRDKVYENFTAMLKRIVNG